MVQSIDEQLNTITQDVADTYTALGAKGATLPAKKGTSNLKATVDSLPKSGFPNKLYDVDANGDLVKPSGTFSEGDFDDIVTVYKDASGYPFYYSFYKAHIEGDIVFKNLTKVSAYAFISTFEGATSTKGFSVKLPKLSTIVGSYSFKSTFYKCKGLKSFECGIKTITYNSAFSSTLRSSTVESISFPELETIKESMPFDNFAESCKSLKTVNFPKLSVITQIRYDDNFFRFTFRSSGIEELEFPELSEMINAGNSYGGGFGYEICSGCLSLKRVSFPKLTTCLKNSPMFYNGFKGCTALTDVNFPLLRNSGQHFINTFYGCTALKNVEFPEMTNAKMETTFYNCTSLVSVSLPKATLFESNGAFYGCSSLPSISFPNVTRFNMATSTFYGCTALTEIHFRADMQATVEALSGYSSKWGATNATIYFDL